jgi:hypothetical protein
LVLQLGHKAGSLRVCFYGNMLDTEH